MNAHQRYNVQSLADYEKQIATIRLLSEPAKGADSLRKDGGLSIEEVFDGLDV